MKIGPGETILNLTFSSAYKLEKYFFFRDKSNFGLLPIDYAKAYIYGQSGENLVGTFIVPRESFLIDGEAIDINIGLIAIILLETSQKILTCKL